MTRSHAHVEALGAAALEFRYEDFLSSPVEVGDALLDFCGLDAPASTREWLEEIDPSRAFAFVDDPQLRALAEAHHEVLARHGYGADPV